MSKPVLFWQHVVTMRDFSVLSIFVTFEIKHFVLEIAVEEIVLNCKSIIIIF